MWLSFMDGTMVAPNKLEKASIGFGLKPNSSVLVND